MLDGHNEKLQIATHSMALSLGSMVAQAETNEKKVEIIRKAVDEIRFEKDKSGYFFVYNGTVNVALPPKKELQGKDLGHLKDKNGVFFVQEMAKTAKSGGFVEYIWPKPGAGDMPNLSYAEAIPGTDMWIGTGVYIDNVQTQKMVIADAVGEVASHAQTLSLVTLGVLLLGICVLGAGIVRSITLPLRETTTAAEVMAQGNLDVRCHVHGKDEVARVQTALNTLVESQAKAMADLQQEQATARQLAERAEESAEKARQALEHAEVAKRQGLQHAAERLESVIVSLGQSSQSILGISGQARESVDNQRMRMSEATTAMEQMNATVLEVARNASQAAEDATHSRNRVMEGRESTNKTLSAVEDLKARTEDLKNSMAELGQRTEAIGQVMVVISDIADQTNLLALNAAIEAARAGEAGKGFAVVADEVRKLAEKTMSATGEVGQTVKAIQGEMLRNRQAMEEADHAITHVAELSEASGDGMNEVARLIDGASGQVSSIATATEEQSAASEQINRAVEEVNELAVNTADLMAETARTVDDMAEQSRLLGVLLDDLKRESHVA